MENEADIVDRALVFREFEHELDGVKLAIALDDDTVVETTGDLDPSPRRTACSSEAEAEALFVQKIRALLAQRPAPAVAYEPAPVVIAGPDDRRERDRADFGDELAPFATRLELSNDSLTLVVEGGDGPAVPRLFDAFVRSSLASKVSSLALRLQFTTRYEETVAMLAERGLPGTLRTLTLCTFRNVEDFLETRASARGIYGAIRDLERLELQGGTLDLEGLELPGLRELQVRAAGMTNTDLAALARVDWPSLERLDLWLGSSFHGGGGASLEGLGPLLSGLHFPKLRHLGLMNTAFTDDLATALLRAPLVGRLASLDLSYGSFGKRGAGALLSSGSAFAHLERLRLIENELDDDACERLEALGGHIEVGQQREPERWVRATGIEHYVPMYVGEGHVFVDMIDEVVEEDLDL